MLGSDHNIRIRLFASGSFGRATLDGNRNLLLLSATTTSTRGYEIYNRSSGTDTKRRAKIVALARSGFRRDWWLHVRYGPADRLRRGNELMLRKERSNRDCCCVGVGVNRLDVDHQLPYQLRF
jgi:hypothetical protein